MTFDQFWQLIDWKTDKGNAEKAYKTKSDWPGDEQAVEIYNAQLKSRGQFQKRPPAWIRAKGWLDEDRPAMDTTVGTYIDSKPLPYAPTWQAISDARHDIEMKWLAHMTGLYGDPAATPVELSVGNSSKVQATAAWHPLNEFLICLMHSWSAKFHKAAWLTAAHADGRCEAERLDKAKRKLLPTLADIELAKRIAARPAPKGTMFAGVVDVKETRS